MGLPATPWSGDAVLDLSHATVERAGPEAVENVADGSGTGSFEVEPVQDGNGSLGGKAPTPDAAADHATRTSR